MTELRLTHLPAVSGIMGIVRFSHNIATDQCEKPVARAKVVGPEGVNLPENFAMTTLGEIWSSRNEQCDAIIAVHRTNISAKLQRGLDVAGVSNDLATQVDHLAFCTHISVESFPWFDGFAFPGQPDDDSRASDIFSHGFVDPSRTIFLQVTNKNGKTRVNGVDYLPSIVHLLGELSTRELKAERRDLAGQAYEARAAELLCRDIEFCSARTLAWLKRSKADEKELVSRMGIPNVRVLH